MVEPGALWESGFQLSFVATGFLLLFWHPIAWRVLPSPPEAEPGLLPVMLRWCLVGLLVSMVATVGTLPLVAYHFNRVSLVSPLANIPIAGMTEALLLGGLTTSTLSVFLPPFFTGFLWLLLNGGLWLFTQLTLTFASVPFASLSVASPSVWFVIAYYAGLSVMAFWVRRLAWRQILFAPER
jgi:competence protein ComEC